MMTDSILEILRRNENIYNISHNGNKKLWFSLEKPENLIVGDELLIQEEPIHLPFGHYTPVNAELFGCMSYWQHLGGRCSSATACLSISPLQKNEGLVEIVWIKPNEIGKNGNIMLSTNKEFISSFCKGIIKGLQSVVSHPIADIKLTIHGIIEDTVESNQMAFLNMGQWIVEALIIEMCKKGIIDRI